MVVEELQRNCLFLQIWTEKSTSKKGIEQLLIQECETWYQKLLWTWKFHKKYFDAAWKITVAVFLPPCWMGNAGIQEPNFSSKRVKNLPSTGFILYNRNYKEKYSGKIHHKLIPMVLHKEIENYFSCRI